MASTELLEHYPLLLSIKQFSEITGLSRSMFYNLVARGDIETVHVGSAVRIRRDEMARFISNLK